MLWVWIVAGIVLGLVLVELFSWVRRSRQPQLEAEISAEATDEEPQAELARANMKIAILESRLAETQEQNAAEMAALLERHRRQMHKTEEAYQRQMVSLSERLTRQVERTRRAEENGGGSPVREYEVRLAGEVSAWLAQFDMDMQERDAVAGEPPEPGEEQPDTLSDKSMPPPQGEFQPQAGARLLAGRVAAMLSEWSEEEEDEGSQAAPETAETAQASGSPADPCDVVTADVPSQETPAGEPARETEPILLLPAPAEAVPIESATLQPDVETLPEEELLQAITLLDDSPSHPPAEPVSDSVKDAIKINSSSPEEAFISYDTGETGTNRDGDQPAARHIPEAASGLEQEVEPVSTAVLAPQGWPARRTRAMQRALERRLGAELDADYLDEDEFLRALGIDQRMLEAVDVPEDLMSSDDWVMDPLEVLASYLRGEKGDADQAEEEPKKDEPPLTADIEPSMWEQLVLSGPEPATDQAANDWAPETHGSGNGAARPAAEQAGEETGASDREQDDPAEEEAIRAAVEAILARAPEEKHANGVAATVPFAADDAARREQPQEYQAEAGDGAGAPEQPDVAGDGVAVDAVPDLVVEEPLEVTLPQTDEPADDGSAEGQIADGPRTPAGDGAGVPEATEAYRELLSALEEETHYRAEAALRPRTPEEALPDEPVQTTRSLEHERQDEEPPLEPPPFVWQREPVTWEAAYFNNTKLAEAPAVVRQDRDILFHWAGRAPAQGVAPRTFSVRWSGTIPLESGVYRFTLRAPDGVRLWLNDRLVVSAWYDQSEQTYRRDFAWQGGRVNVRVEHYENGGDARAFFTWERIA